MTIRLAASIVIVCLYGHTLAAQAPPQLSRQQRETLLALVNGVDAAAQQPAIDDAQWQSHLMRASDGSHYVAFSVEPPASAPLPKGPALLYIRLATSNQQAAQRIAERSAIRDWLAGSRTDPRLLPRRGIAMGDMPIMGPTGNMNPIRQPTSTGLNEMRLLALERERTKKKQEEQEKQRRAELEGRAAATRELFPFEDFDLASQSVRGDARIITRALTAGPGEYDLYLAWADPAHGKPASTVRVLRKSLTLPPALTTGLSMGSVVFADSVLTRDLPYPPTEQASHPYSIGVMEITPARDSHYTRDDDLSVAFQIINASASDMGMPDLTVGFRIVRVSEGRESAVASLRPQQYNGTTLPPDFDLRQGHPVFAAVSAPLATLGRGDYRLKIAISDRLSGAATTADADFSVVGTIASLLAEAPPLGRPFSRDTILKPDALAPVIDLLAPASPSPQLARALALARDGKLVELLVEEPVAAGEAGIRSTLTGLALLPVAEASAVVQLQRGLQEGAPAGPAQHLIGAARAIQNRDADAIAAWETALATGRAPAGTRQLLVEALLRRGDSARAAAVVADTPRGGGSAEWTRLTAATHIAGGRFADAVAVLDAHRTTHPDDEDARWLLLHALFGEVASGGNRERFAAEARRYIDTQGRNSDLVAEWLRVVATS